MSDDLISRRAILKHIEEIRRDVRMMDDTRRASIIMTGVNLCEEAVRNQSSAHPEDKCGECDAWNQYKNYPRLQWIPCSQRLPEAQKKTYWICTDSGYQCECRWTNINHLWPNLTTDWHWHMLDVPQFSKVVAWMPLLEPYKEE